MTDIEKDLRAAAYHLGSAKPYLERTGRTLTAMAVDDEIASIEGTLERIFTPLPKEPES